MSIMADTVTRPKYQKGRGGEYAGGAGPLLGRGQVRLRITLGDMPLDDAFEAELGDVDLDQPLGSLLEALFGDESDWAPSDAEIARNPDLPDMRAELNAILRSSRQFRSVLQLHVNHGQQAQPDDSIGSLRRARPGAGDSPEAALLDLVLEQRFTPLAYSASRGFWQSKDDLLERLEEQALLTLAGSGDTALQGVDGRLREVSDRLRGKGLLDESLSFTSNAASALQELRASSRSLRRRYDAFADVTFDSETEAVEIGSGRGVDMRPEVYEEEGLDPVASAFEAIVLDDVHEWLDDWADSESPADFFDRLLAWTVEPEPPDAETLDLVIEAGFTYMEEVQERAEAAARASTAVRRARRLDASG